MPTDEQFWRYCCQDSAATLELKEILAGGGGVAKPLLGPQALSHAAFNAQLLPVLLYMQLRGFNYDYEQAQKELAAKVADTWRWQHEVNEAAGGVAAGFSLPRDTAALAARLAATKLVNKVKARKRIAPWTLAGCVEHANATGRGALVRIRELVESGDNGGVRDAAAVWGEVSVLARCHLNVDSPAAMQRYLFGSVASGGLGLPPMFKKERGRNTDRLTQNKDALLKLYGKARDDAATQGILKRLLRLRAALDVCAMLRCKPDADGRVRCAYNLVGTETGRLSCYGSPTDSGYNLQTVPDKLRHLFRADPGHLLVQADLSGADGWTIAAHCKALGDSRMWDDQRLGIKPAKALTVLFREGAKANEWPDAKMIEACREVRKSDWEYAAFKKGIWGTCYTMGPMTMSDKIMEESYKETGEPLFVPVATCKEFQALVHVRYKGIRRWQERCRMALKATGRLVAPSGHTRTFLDDRDGHGTLGQYLADEPQENTTYATKLALRRAWHDEENNRVGFPPFAAEPIHSVHDSGIWQVPEGLRAWMHAKLGEWFDNPLTIAGQRVTIPAEWGCGPSWGEQESF